MNKNLLISVIVKKIHLLLILFSLLQSCSVREKIVYFQDQTSKVDTTVFKNFGLNLKSGDLISINVYGVDEELSRILNQNITTTGQPANYINGVAPKDGYLIDNKGQIDFPLLGKIELEGKSILEVKQILQEKLSTISADAKVFVKLQNFKITVLGDVRNPGTFTIPNERISLLEALGLAGDLNITGVRNNILIIRDVDGIKSESRIDLTKKDFFQSEYFYLSQNDVVYVEPNRAKRNTSIISSAAGVFISIASLLITTVNLIAR